MSLSSYVERDKNEEVMPVFNDLQRLFQQSHEGLPDFSVSIGYAKYDESLNYIPKFIEKQITICI